MDKLNLLRMFLCVVDAGSFAKAAVALGASASTVSKAIGRLEQELGLVLFYRTTRQLRLTESGSIYAKTARSLLAELEICESSLQQGNEQPQGKLRINAPHSYGRLYVLPLLAEFNRLFPNIQLEMNYNDVYVDIIEQGVDICFRTGTLAESNLIARRLSPMDFLICASPEYAKQHGPISVNEYSQHPWIRFRFRQTGRLMPIYAKVGRSYKSIDPGQQFVVDDGEGLARLCADGLGLTQIPHFTARNWIDSGKIVPVAPYYRPPNNGVWIIYVKREFLPAKIRVFVEFMLRKISELGESPDHTWVEDLKYQ